MAQYTIELLEVIKSLALIKSNNSITDYDTVDDFVDDNFHLIFRDYGLDDKAHQEILSRKIVKHFLFDEISVTPYAKWVFLLNRKLEEIMPYYNQLYAVEFTPIMALLDTDYTETLDRTVDTETGTHTERESNTDYDRTNTDTLEKESTSTSTQEEASNNKSVTERMGSDVPFDIKGAFNSPTQTSKDDTVGNTDSSYSGVGNENEVRNDERITKSLETIAGSSNSQLDSGTREIYEKHFKGKKGGVLYSDAFIKYQKAIINIDMMIIGELRELFRFIFN